MNVWYIEQVSRHEQHRHGVQRAIYEGRTRWQKVQVLQSFCYGKLLVLDDDIQSAEADERIYHEALVHPALIARPHPARSVLIMGGGEGAALREVLRHRSVERVVMVDLDDELVAICKKYLPEWAGGAFDDPRLELHAGDARSWIDVTRERFDCVIHDLPQPLGESPLRRLFTRQCFSRIGDIMETDGVLGMQACSAKMTTNGVHLAIVNTARAVFRFAHAAHVFVSSFSNDWGFCVASRQVDPAALSPHEIDLRIRDRIDGDLEVYSGAMHRALFAIPPWYARALEATTIVMDDDVPFPDSLFVSAAPS